MFVSTLAKKEIAYLNDACTHDKDTIKELRGQVDELVGEAHTLSESKTFYIETSGIILKRHIFYYFICLIPTDKLKKEIEAFSQEKALWEQERSRIQSHFDGVVVELEKRLTEVCTSNSYFKCLM